MDSNEHTNRQDVVLDLNFVPTWARESPTVNPYANFEHGERLPRRDRSDRRGGPPSRREGPRDRRGPPRHDKRPDERSRRPSGPRREYGPRPAASPAPVSSETPVQPALDISFIPERRRLAILVRDLQHSCRAFPLMDLAGRFLSNPDFYLVKIEVRHTAGVTHPRRLAQCKECKMVFADRNAVITHAVGAHLDLHFEKETVTIEPPSGSFVCVARCRRSGELLGPPNYHGYNEKLMELHRTRFAHLSLDEYRASIETVKDADLIEKWKQECSTQTVYRLKGQENPESLKKTEVENLFRERFANALVVESGRMIVPASVAQRVEDPYFRSAIRDAWQRESRFPFTLSLALRPAFRHMRLFLFKVKGGQTFVSHIHPKPLDPSHAVENIREVLEYLHAHPGCMRQNLLQELRPGLAPEAPEGVELLNPLRWLIERGHVIEFFDGTLSVPSSGAQRQEARREKPSPAKETVTAAAADAATPVEPSVPPEPT